MRQEQDHRQPHDLGLAAPRERRRRAEAERRRQRLQRVGRRTSADAARARPVIQKGAGELYGTNADRPPIT